MKISKIILATILIPSLVLLGSASAGAVSANDAQGLQISPTRQEFNASRGDILTINLKVMNVTASDLVYSTSVADFSAKDESGSPSINLDSNLGDMASIKTWVDTIPSFKLAAHQSLEITARVTIPDNAEPGGHYGVLSFSGMSPELQGTGVGLSASTGMLLLIRVDGDVVEKASLSSFFTSIGDSQTSFFENGPIGFVTRIKNEGNIHIKPTGKIEIRDMFGGITKQIDVNADSSNVLPDSIRKFDSSIPDKWLFGLYTANLTLGYGTTGQAITSTISFWVIPYKIILAGIFTLGTIIYVSMKVMKAHNQRIIERYKNASTKKSSKKD